MGEFNLTILGLEYLYLYSFLIYIMVSSALGLWVRDAEWGMGGRGDGETRG